MADSVSYAEKHIEDRLSKIGAKIVKATKNSFTAKKLCEESNLLLLDAQTEIADLYESLGDVLKSPTEKNAKSTLIKNQSSSPED